MLSRPGQVRFLVTSLDSFMAMASSIGNKMALNPPPPPPPPNIVSLSEKDVLGSHCYQVPQALLTLDNAVEQVAEASKNAVRIGDDNVLVVIFAPCLRPILQSGPVCGLIALVEAAEILGSSLNPDALLDDAIKLGLTQNGEMFSISDMQQLADKWLNIVQKCWTKILDTSDQKLWEKLITHLAKGNVALLPYDADYNHAPALRKGHAAHWTVIHGLAVQIPKELFSSPALNQENLLILDSTKDFDTVFGILDKILETQTLDSAYVVAHQGKSLRTAVWSYKKLIQSNQNLEQLSPKILSSSTEYVLKDMKTELCSKILLIGK